MPRLRRTNPSQPGLSRRRRGPGWEYRDVDGGTVTDPDVRQRISDLVIPPAWQDVWICPSANGHLQAVGTDAAGRRQYLYHPAWQANRSRIKYDRARELGAALPRARTTVADHLGVEAPTRRRALAAAFRLLDCGHFRIGGEVYAESNGSFGLATIRREHVKEQHGILVFEYVAKSGVAQIEKIRDETLLESIGAMRRRRGGDFDELLAYRDGRNWQRITSAEINAYVKNVLSLEVSAKDFRTWHGTVLASVALAEEFVRHPDDQKWSKSAREKAIRQSVVAVAENLGNTPAVCRGSYIDPRVVERFREGVTVSRAVARARTSLLDPPTAVTGDGLALAAIGAAPTVERAVLRLLAD